MLDLFSDDSRLVRIWPRGIGAACDLASWSTKEIDRAAGIPVGTTRAIALGDVSVPNFMEAIKAALLVRVALPFSLKVTGILLKPKELWGVRKMRRPFASEIAAFDPQAAARIEHLKEIERHAERMSRFDEAERRRGNLFAVEEALSEFGRPRVG